MRDALSHLRVLTLPQDKLSLLLKYFSPEEIDFLTGKLLFEDENSSSPPSLNSNANPRSKIFCLELIPEHLIIADHRKMIDQDLDYCYGGKTKFCYTIDVGYDFCLKGIEILTQAKNFPDFKKTTANNKTR